MTRRYSSQPGERNSTATSSTRRLEAGAADELLDPIRLAERELSGLARLRRLHQSALEQDRTEDGRPGVPLRGRPGREGKPAIGPEDAARLPKRERRIGGDHVAEPADDGVDARVRQVDRLHVHHADLHTLEPAGGAASTIAGEKSVVVSRATRGASSSASSPVPPASSSRVSCRAWRERREKRVGHGRVEARDRVAMLLPAAGRRVPALPAFGSAPMPSPGRTAAGSRRRRPAAPLPARASSGRC